MPIAAAQRMRRMCTRRRTALSVPILYERADWKLFVDPQTLPQEAARMRVWGFKLRRRCFFLLHKTPHPSSEPVGVAHGWQTTLLHEPAGPACSRPDLGIASVTVWIAARASEAGHRVLAHARIFLLPPSP